MTHIKLSKPNDFPANVSLAWIRATSQRQRRSAKSPEQRQQLDRQYAAANYNLAVHLRSTGETSEALEHLRLAVAANPDQKVTIRERDTTDQERIAQSQVAAYLSDKIFGY